MIIERICRWVIRISLFFSVGFLIWGFILYPHLPEEIPIQIGFDGMINRWGSKITIFVLPIVLLGTTLVSKSKTNDLKFSGVSYENRLSRIVLCGCLLLTCVGGTYLFFLYEKLTK